jgi:hypothetical protein
MRPRLASALASLYLSACGYICERTGEGCKKSDAPPPVVAQVTMSMPQAADLRFAFTDSNACNLDPDTGLLTVQYQGHDPSGDHALSVAVRGLQSTPASYRCQQASNNAASATDVGDLYEECMVAVTTPGASGLGASGFAMHREAAAVKPFTYGGSCVVDILQTQWPLMGSFNCTDMAEVTLAGLPRNPVAADGVHPDATASFAGTFQCDVTTAKTTPSTPVPTPPPPVAATVQAAVASGAATSATLPAALACAFDADSGLLKASFGTGAGAPGGAELDLEVRDFRPTETMTYTCKQAADNATGAAGDLYEGCMVAVRVPRSTATPATIDGYGMDRATAAVKPFAYGGQCTVSVTPDAADLKGIVACKAMAQVELGGLPRNPIAEDGKHPEVTADVTATFSCRLPR